MLDPRDSRWDLWWCDTCELKIALDSSTKLRPGQRVSHFRNHSELTRKNYLYRNLKRYRRMLVKAGKPREAELCDSMPISFELPNEYRMLVEEYRRRPGTTWIVKPSMGSQVSLSPLFPGLALQALLSSPRDASGQGHILVPAAEGAVGVASEAMPPADA